MSKLQFCTGLRQPFNIPAMARRIEELGFDAACCGEHVMFHGDIPNGFISLAQAAAVTTELKIMSAITLVPLYPAALLAKLGAALDVASNGRYLFGVGVGGEFPKEFEACGIPMNERGSRTNETLEILHKVWSEGDVTFDGKYATMKGFSVKPMPVQKPRPPMWISGRKPVAMRRAAKYGDGWLPYMYTPERLAESVQTIGEECEKLDRDPAEVKTGLYIFTAVHEDGPTGVKMAAEKLGTHYAQDFTKIVSKYALGGTPEQCRSRLREYLDVGAEFIILSSACPDDYLDTNIELIAKEMVAPLRERA